jgi:hypothetical protein
MYLTVAKSKNFFLPYVHTSNGNTVYSTVQKRVLIISNTKCNNIKGIVGSAFIAFYCDMNKLTVNTLVFLKVKECFHFLA